MECNQTKVKEIPEVRIAIFGLGRIGTIHLENLRKNPRARISYCVDESSERAEYVQNTLKLKEEDTIFLNTSEQNVVFQDTSVDAIVVCTPTFAHEELVIKGLQSGKAVFCEKPLALNYEGIEKCYEAARKFNKPLLCAFNRRFDPGLRSLKVRIDSGEIGKVQVIKTCSRDHPRPPTEYLKISGGLFQDCSVHDLDYICWVLGEFPEQVSVFGHVHLRDIRELGDLDTACIMMKFPGGAISLTDLSRNAVYGYDQRVEIFGAEGMLTNGENRPTGVRSHTVHGTTAIPIYGNFAGKYRESYEAEMEHFLKAVQGIEVCEVKRNSILAVYRMANACHEAVHTGKIISLDWTDLNYES